MVDRERGGIKKCAQRVVKSIIFTGRTLCLIAFRRQKRGREKHISIVRISRGLYIGVALAPNSHGSIKVIAHQVVRTGGVIRERGISYTHDSKKYSSAGAKTTKQLLALIIYVPRIAPSLLMRTILDKVHREPLGVWKILR